MKAIKRTMESNEKAAMVIDHDIYFVDIVSDSLSFRGRRGQTGTCCWPAESQKGDE